MPALRLTHLCILALGYIRAMLLPHHSYRPSCSRCESALADCRLCEFLIILARHLWEYGREVLPGSKFNSWSHFGHPPVSPISAMADGLM